MSQASAEHITSPHRPRAIALACLLVSGLVFYDGTHALAKKERREQKLQSVLSLGKRHWGVFTGNNRCAGTITVEISSKDESKLQIEGLFRVLISDSVEKATLKLSSNFSPKGDYRLRDIELNFRFGLSQINLSSIQGPEGKTKTKQIKVNVSTPLFTDNFQFQQPTDVYFVPVRSETFTLLLPERIRQSISNRQSLVDTFFQGSKLKLEEVKSKQQELCATPLGNGQDLEKTAINMQEVFNFLPANFKSHLLSGIKQAK